MKTISLAAFPLTASQHKASISNTSLIFITFCLLTSCISYKPLIPAKDSNAGNVTEMIARVTRGKVYRFQLRNGNVVEMKVTQIDKGILSGESYQRYDPNATHSMNSTFKRKGDRIRITQTILQEDIKGIQKRKVSAGKTALLVGAIVVPVTLILAIINKSITVGFQL